MFPSLFTFFLSFFKTFFLFSFRNKRRTFFSPVYLIWRASTSFRVQLRFSNGSDDDSTYILTRGVKYFCTAICWLYLSCWEGVKRARSLGLVSWIFFSFSFVRAVLVCVGVCRCVRLGVVGYGVAFSFFLFTFLFVSFSFLSFFSGVSVWRR